jgi:DNA modification methylase
MPRSSAQSAAPTLTWPDKRAPLPVEPVRPVLVETFEPFGRALLDAGDPLASTWNRLLLGDNLPILHALAAREAGRYKLIYADPPYGSGVRWARKVRLRGSRELSRRVLLRQPEYEDRMDDAQYLQFMLDRLVILRDLLAEDGTIWLHCDHRHTHHLRALLAEIFGADNWLNTITWRSQTARGAKSGAHYFPHSAHSIHIFRKDARATPTWNAPKRRLVLSEAEAAAEFMRDEGGFFRTSDPGSYSFESLKRLHGEGRLYAPYGGHILVDDVHQRITCSHGGNIGVKYYLKDLGQGRHLVERTVDNVWDDIPGLGTTPAEDTGYPTQKTTALLERIISVATNPGDWVLDPFSGSGTTLVTAQRMGRRWVGCDASARAVDTALQRVSGLVLEELHDDPDAPPPHAALLAAAPVAHHTALPGALTLNNPGAPQTRLLITRNAVGAARIRVDLTGYTSERLEALLPVQPVDWRACVERVAIDPNFDGHLFRAAVADAPTRRNRTVAGSYEVDVPAQATHMAVRVTDVLGESVTVTFTVTDS